MEKLPGVAVIYRELRFLYAAEQETGLVNLGRSSLCRGAIFRL